MICVPTWKFDGKPDEYMEDVRAVSELRDGQYCFSTEDFQALRRKYNSKPSVVDYARAQLSRVCAVPEETVEQRRASCASCNWIRESKTPNQFFCGACGCGDRKGAFLETKYYIPRVKCPLKRKGWANAD